MNFGSVDPIQEIASYIGTRVVDGIGENVWLG